MRTTFVSLDGLAQKEVDGNKVILPAWHNITVEEIKRHSPILAGRYGVSSDFGLDHVIEELLRAISISAKDTASEL
jgi:hypothetical protein